MVDPAPHQVAQCSDFERKSNTVDGVAQMQAGDGAARALDLAVIARRKDDGRAMHAILDATGDDADHALVPGRVV